jgi:hypothetical protein
MTVIKWNPAPKKGSKRNETKEMEQGEKRVYLACPSDLAVDRFSARMEKTENPKALAIKLFLHGLHMLSLSRLSFLCVGY